MVLKGKYRTWKAAVIIFRDYASIDDIRDALVEVDKRKGAYNTPSRVLHGVREYLWEVKGITNIPFRAHYLIDNILKENGYE